MEGCWSGAARPPDTPERRSHMVSFKCSDGTCNLGGARRSSVKMIFMRLSFRVKWPSRGKFDGEREGESASIGRENAGLPNIYNLKHL